MASSFEIKGKTLIKSGVSILGQTSADDQIRVVHTRFNHEVHTSESGPNIPAAVFNAGLFAIIAIPFNHWDQSVVDGIVMAQGATLDGQLGTLGQILTYFPIQILPAITGAIEYTFPTCYVTDDQTFENFGVMPAHRRILSIKAIPDPDNLDVTTTSLFTTSVV